MECEALRLVREDMGLTNVQILIPFVRTLTGAEGVIAGQFLDHFDGSPSGPTT